VITAVYVIFGGLIAVMYTDAFQGTIMFVGMAVLLVLTYLIVGGVNAGNAALTNMAGLVPAALGAQGMTGWTSMPGPWFAHLVYARHYDCGSGSGSACSPSRSSWVRFMTAKDDKSLNRAVLVGGIFILMMTGVAFTVGALSNVYFYEHAGTIAIDAAGGNVDAVIPLFINEAMPDIFVALFMLTLLAAAMSTLSSLYHAMGTALICDLWGRGRECALSLRNHQAGIIVMMVLSTALAFALPVSIIARATAMFMGLCAAAFLPAFAVGNLRETAVHESGNREHGLGSGCLVFVDRVCPYSRGKAARDLPGALWGAVAPAPALGGNRSARDCAPRFARGDGGAPEALRELRGAGGCGTGRVTPFYKKPFLVTGPTH